MQRHAAIGAEIIGDTEFPIMQTAREIALSHHERYDGCGYPHRKAGEAIPFSARIVAAADVFDALTHTRPYRGALPLDQVVEMLTSEIGKHFDPDVLEALLRVVATADFDSDIGP